MNVILTETSCSIPYTEKVLQIKIKYAGKALIDDKTPNNYMLYEKDNCIYIQIFKKGKISLETLFNYEGKFNILYFYITTSGSEQKELKVKDLRYEFVTERITRNTEDLTVLTENMKKHKQTMFLKKLKLKKTKINNLYFKNRFFIQDTGELYTGFAHLHLDGPHKLHYMTGKTHTKNSKKLMDGYPVPTVSVEGGNGG